MTDQELFNVQYGSQQWAELTHTQRMRYFDLHREQSYRNIEAILKGFIASMIGLGICAVLIIPLSFYLASR